MAVENQGTLLAQLQLLNRLPMQQKIGLLFSIAAIIAVLAVAVIWEQTPEYRVLYSNLNDKDGGAIIAALQQMNIPYKFSDAGGALLVPSNQVHEARLKLASQGLPKGSLVGFELMENEKFGTSQFVEQVNYQRALEGELARTIQSLSAVQSARVHLAIPKPSVFVREQEKPTASVLLNIYPGRSLDQGQVSAIAHLVSSGVPELSAKNVTVVDQNGNLLNQPSDLAANGGLEPGQLKYLQEVERSYIKRIEGILAPVVGAENVRAQVTAAVDFSQVENTSETYRPNQAPGSAAIRSQQISENSSNSAQTASGVPGSLSNQPPAPVSAPLAATVATKPTATSGNTSNAQKDSTTNYEVDKSIQHTKNPVGTVKRLSVAVVLNYQKNVDSKGKASYKPLPATTISQINGIVREAMGFDATRGDTLNIVNAAFTAPPEEAAASIPWWKQVDIISLLTSIAKNLAIAGVVFYLIFAVIRPALKNLKFEAAKVAAMKPPEEKMPPAAMIQEQGMTAETAKELARQNPQLVANVIKGWVAGNE